MTAKPPFSVLRSLSSRYFLFYFVLALAAGSVLRCLELDRRPMHNDEAVNAIKFRQLWEQGLYKYDPDEFHGPTLFYSTLAVGRLTGAPEFDQYSEGRLRLITVLFGLGLLLVLPLIVDGLGRVGAAWAALFTAVSPALVFYSRYFIHEMLLVFFTFLVLAAGWRYWRSRKVGWVLLAGAALGLMHATKETFVLNLGAAVLALGLNQIWNRWLDASGPPVKAPRLNPWHLGGAFGVWLAVALLLFSSFFTNFQGLLDSLRTYLPWLNRAGGASPHLHPWYFYLQRLLWFHVAKGPVWSEAVILGLALVGALAGFRRRQLGRANPSFVRFVALYTFVLAGCYTLLPYKTPWCLLGFWQTMILLAGVGSAVLLRAFRHPAWRMALSLALLAGAGHLAWLAWQANTTYAADPRNPYVYAQTSPDLLKLTDKVQSFADVSPQGRHLLVKVMAAGGDYWPLPWYLRRLDQVGWWDQLPSDPYAPVMIVSAKLNAALDENKTHLMVGYFELRPRVFLELYVRSDLWRLWLAKHPPPRSD